MLYSTPEKHAANPPETWQVVKIGPRSWALTDRQGGVFQVWDTRRQAEEARVGSFYVRLWEQEGRWFAGEQVPGWKPYQAAS